MFMIRIKITGPTKSGKSRMVKIINETLRKNGFSDFKIEESTVNKIDSSYYFKKANRNRQRKLQ